MGILVQDPIPLSFRSPLVQWELKLVTASTPGYRPKITGMAKKWKQPKRPTTDERTNKCGLSTWWILFSNVKNKVWIHVMIWTTLEKSMLSQRSQTQKATRYMTPCTGNVQKRQIQRQKGEEGCHKAGGWETGSDCQWGGISLGNDGNVLELNSGDGRGQWTCYYEQHTFKWLKWWIVMWLLFQKKKSALKNNLLSSTYVCGILL